MGIGTVQGVTPVKETGFIGAFKKAGRGILHLGELGTRALYDAYSIEGFERISKAMVANLRMLSLFPALKGIFANSIEALEAHKDLCYATLVFDTTANFIKSEKDSVTNKTRYSLQIPKYKTNDNKYRWDWGKILYGVGNFFETGKFLIRYKVLQFPLCSQIASKLGSIPLNMLGKGWKLKDIPVVNALFDAPKDFFVFIASVWSTGKCLSEKKEQFYSVENLLKLTGNIGKIVLISCGQILLKNHFRLAKTGNHHSWYIITLTVVDVITNNASLIGLFVKKHSQRTERFKEPVALKQLEVKVPNG